MKVSRVKELLSQGHEFEFEYNGKRYGLTWSDLEGDKNILCFYEFDSDNVVESSDIDEVLSATYNGCKISDIIETLDENEVDVF